MVYVSERLLIDPWRVVLWFVFATRVQQVDDPASMVARLPGGVLVRGCLVCYDVPVAGHALQVVVRDLSCLCVVARLNPDPGLIFLVNVS